MIQTALSAILITIATPLQLCLTLVAVIPAALWGKKILNSGHEYVHLDIYRAQQHIDLCVERYGSHHELTASAYEAIDALFRKYHQAELLALEDLEMYVEIGRLNGSLFDELTT